MITWARVLVTYKHISLGKFILCLYCIFGKVTYIISSHDIHPYHVNIHTVRMFILWHKLPWHNYDIRNFYIVAALQVCVQVYMCAYVFACVYICACVCVCVYACVYVCLYPTEAILQRHLQCDISVIRQYWVITTC